MGVLYRINSLAWRYKWGMILAYISLLLSVAVTVAIPRLLGMTVDQVVNAAADRTVLINMAVLLLLASLGRGIFDFGRTFFQDYVSQKVTYDLRNSLYNKWQHLSFGYHDKEHTGDLMSRATADVESMRRFINLGLLRSVHTLLLTVVVAVLMARINWQLALLSMCFMPFVIFRATLLIRQLRRLWTRIQELTGELVTVLQENLSGMAVVKAFAAEEHEKRKFAAKGRELFTAGFQADKLEGLNSASNSLVLNLATVIILWYGGTQVIHATLSIGEFTEFVFLMSMMIFPVRQSAWIINTFSRAVSSGERVFQVLDARSPVREKPDAIELRRANGEVTFDHVTFGYDAARPVLRDINVQAPPGRVTAILGAPGSGKTTIVHLLPRFYDPNEGSIKLDGVDLRDYSLASLRRNVGIVAQDVFLFAATIRDNIAYGREGISNDDIIQAAKIAQLHDFIMELPHGYDTWVGERGATLSGGQRQRLAIARTVLLDPPVLILDDSTSSVDVNTERRIRQAMQAVVKGRTTFIIAHRLSTVQHADWIVVLDEGRVAEEGTHLQLYARPDSLYRQIYDLQLRPQEEVLREAEILRVELAANNDD